MIKLDRIQNGDWDTLIRVIDKLRFLVPDTGGQSLGIRVGSGTVTFTASTSSAQTTVTHGLGRTPAVVIAVNNAVGATGIVMSTFTLTSTTFKASGFFGSSAITATTGFWWMAIG